jgi:hypothetical protein
MKKKVLAPVIGRGYARDESDEKRLRKCGVRVVYRADQGETLDRVNMRPGEFLGVVDGYKALADHRVQMVKAYQRIHKMGATVIDAETLLQSREDGGEMMRRALAPKNALTPERAAELAMLAAKERIKDGRWPSERALRVYRDDRYDNDEFAEMTGWSYSTFYSKFGPRFKRKMRA